MNNPIISIWCLVYNHGPYLRDCLEGFVRQMTEYPFEVIVHDDVSTDDSANIINEYAEKYPEIIKPIFETENQWSKKNGSLVRIFKERCLGKYIAFCEGDDYWTDSHKLQRQVQFLEEHPEYVMCCSDATIKTREGELNWSRYDKDSDIDPLSMIVGGGLFVQTCTLVYRRKFVGFLDFDFVRKCHIRDYPLQIWCVLNGKVRYIAERTAVYRYETEGSWTSQNKINTIDKKISDYRTEIDMLLGFDKKSKGKYHDAFGRAIANTIYMLALFKNPKCRYTINKTSEVHEVLNAFQDVKGYLSKSESLDIWLVVHGLKYLFFIKRYLVAELKKIRQR